MKKFFRMLGLIILIGNIGFAEYTIKDGKVYWDDKLVVKYVNGVVGQYNKFLPDVESFKILKDGYARDKGTIYYDGETVKKQNGDNEVDIKTFEILEKNVARDKNTVYINGIDYPNVDVNTVKIVKSKYDFINYVKDKNGIYWIGSPDVEANRHYDKETFEDLGDFFARDKNYIYYFEKPLKFIDKASFKRLSDSYISDKNGIYYLDKIIKGADKNSFEIMEWDYAKDKNNIYYEDKKVSGADINTFEVKEDIVKDKNSIYSNGKKLEGADIQTFRKLNEYYDIDKNNIYYNLNSNLDIKRIKNTDGNFKIIEEKLIKNKDGMYYLGEKIKEIDPNSFKIIRKNNLKKDNSYYAKDSKNVYYIQLDPSYILDTDNTLKNVVKVLKGANPNTFEVINDYYSKDDKNIFYISWIVEKEPLIKGADIKTFEVLNNDFSKDKDNVYFRTDREEDLDSKSFKILNLNSQNRNGYYLEDKNGIYFLKIDDFGNYFNKVTDKGKFLNDFYIKNNDYVYCNEDVLNEADPNTFKVVDEHSSRAEDKNHKYEYCKIIK